MNVDVCNVSRDGKPLECSVPAEEFGEIRPGVRVAGMVTLSCVARRQGHDVLVNGSASGEYGVACSRCLKEFGRKFEVAVEGTFVKAGEGHDDDAEDVPIWTGEDSYEYDGIDIDVVPMIRDELILDTPVKFLCDSECKGLCPSCGADLDSESCSCERDDVDPRLAVLKDMFREMSE
jgi:uncharacterized protein